MISLDRQSLMYWSKKKGIIFFVWRILIFKNRMCCGLIRWRFMRSRIQLIWNSYCRLNRSALILSRLLVFMYLSWQNFRLYKFMIHSLIRFFCLMLKTLRMIKRKDIKRLNLTNKIQKNSQIHKKYPIILQKMKNWQKTK
jgi:hypothetical protein